MRRRLAEDDAQYKQTIPNDFKTMYNVDLCTSCYIDSAGGKLFRMSEYVQLVSRETIGVDTVVNITDGI